MSFLDTVNNKNDAKRDPVGSLVFDKLGFIAANYGVALVLVIIIIIVSFISPSFFSVQNFQNILKQISVIGILSCGMTFVIIAGGIDLSVGSIISLAGVMVINFVQGYGVVPAIIFTLLVGTIIGLISGSVISKIKGRLGESFMITYGMQTVIAAIAFIYTGGIFQSGADYGLFSSIGKGMSPIIIYIIIVAIMQFILTKTIFGRIVYFLGGNVEATRLSGINVKLYRTIVFMISGLMAAISAVVLTSRVGAGSPSAGLGYELDAIAAVVVGGVSMKGGSGSLLNTVLGVIIMGVLGNALNILNVTAYPQMIIKGIIIILAVVLDAWNKSRK